MSQHRPRLPEPSPPPWINSDKPPAEFYRPLFTPMTKGPAPSPEAMRAACVCAGLTLIGAVLPIAPAEDDD